MDQNLRTDVSGKIERLARNLELLTLHFDTVKEFTFRLGLLLISIIGVVKMILAEIGIHW